MDPEWGQKHGAIRNDVLYGWGGEARGVLGIGLMDWWWIIGLMGSTHASRSSCAAAQSAKWLSLIFFSSGLHDFVPANILLAVGQRGPNPFHIFTFSQCNA